MARSFALCVEVVGICPIHMLHDLRQIARGCFQQQMIMVAHQAVGMNNCPIAYYRRFKIRKEFFSIHLAFKDILTIVSSAWMSHDSMRWGIQFVMTCPYLFSFDCYALFEAKPIKESPLVKCVGLTPTLPTSCKSVAIRPVLPIPQPELIGKILIISSVRL